LGGRISEHYEQKVCSLQRPRSSNRPSANEVEPIKTYRGHTAPVTTVAISSAHSAIFSASLDSTIRVWKLPKPSDELYASFDPSVAYQTLEGHTDAVWDLVLLPGAADANGKTNEDRRLVSCAADGHVKVWSLEGKRWSLTESWALGEGDDVPTCLGVYNHDFGQVLVGFTSGLVQVVNVETGAVAMQLGEAKNGESCPSGFRTSCRLLGAQVNAVLSHPTLPAVIVAHEDGYLRVYESKSSESCSLLALNAATATPTHSILAHPKAITSLSLSPLSPMAVLTASVDCTVRLWDLNKQTSLQEFGGHRKKSDEGVCCVASHPELPVVASAGADGVIRIWAAT
jgi:striatin 1/3/4